MCLINVPMMFTFLKGLPANTTVCTVPLTNPNIGQFHWDFSPAESVGNSGLEQSMREENLFWMQTMKKPDHMCQVSCSKHDIIQA